MKIKVTKHPFEEKNALGLVRYIQIYTKKEVRCLDPLADETVFDITDGTQTDITTLRTLSFIVEEVL